MRRLEQVLPNAMPSRAIAHAAEAWRALHRWPEVVGEPLALRSWPDRFEKGTAWIAVESGEWAQELRMQQPVILLRLRELLGGKDLVRDVRFGVRPLPPRPPTVKPKPRVKREGEIADIVQRILERAKEDE